MDGILNVYKEKGMSSHDVVNEVRRIFKTKQVGHTGTLDSNAEGVLVVCINSATKLVQFLESDTKKYRAELVIGIDTDSYDVTGNITSKTENMNISYEMVKNTIESFVGKQQQLPPIYSAIKVNGRKLYDYALKNKQVEITPRNIEIFDIEVLDNELTKTELGYALNFEVTVSKGTYIRSICHDIGLKLNIPCTMGNLLRLRSGNFGIENAKKLEEIKNGDYTLKNMIDALQNIEKIDVTCNEEINYKVNNGMKISLKSFDKKYEKIAFTNSDKLMAIYEYFEEDNFKYYRAVRVWK